MNIRIYQINTEKDSDRKAFLCLDTLERMNGSNTVDSSIYDKVFEGNVDCSGLESVYRMFNVNHPEGYTGRSLSVSDVVEVVDSTKLVGQINTEYGIRTYTDYAEYLQDMENLKERDEDFNAHDLIGLERYSIEPGFYFCDTVGFQPVHFDPELTQEAAKKTITVVLVEPGRQARIAEIDASLAGMQRVVDDDIEAFYPFAEEVCIVCAECGKIEGKPLNRAIRDEDGDIMEIIAGTFFICDCSGESFGSLTQEQLARYTKQYQNPERFIRMNDAIRAIPYKPAAERER